MRDSNNKQLEALIQNLKKKKQKQLLNEVLLLISCGIKEKRNKLLRDKKKTHT